MKPSEFSELYPGVLVHHTAKIDVDDFRAGAGTVVNAHAMISGTRVHLGRECWIDEYALIGGGSCWDNVAFLEAGDWLHLGQFSQLNTARGISVGDEVGIGIGTRIFTHGAYLSEWDGFPVSFDGVSIGNRVWLPNSLVNPGVRIGNDVVVASGSVVSIEIPAGSLAGGIPAKILKSNIYPKRLPLDERKVIMNRLRNEIQMVLGFKTTVKNDFSVINFENTDFDLTNRTIVGEANPRTELLRNQLRRHGIRFRIDNSNGVYRAWS